MPLENSQTLFEFLILVLGCALYVRLVAIEKHRRERLLELQPAVRMKPVGHKKPALGPVLNKHDDVVAVAQPVNVPAEPLAR